MVLIPVLGFTQQKPQTNVERLQQLATQWNKENNELIKKKNTTDSSDLQRLSRAGELFQLKNGKPVYIAPDSELQAQALNTDLLYNNTIEGVSLSGEGVGIYQWDSGSVLTTHQEFEGRAENMETTDVTAHANAVAGVMVAAGIDSQAKGMAYQADVKAYRFDNNFAEIAEVSTANTNYALSNHSYGWSTGWKERSTGWYWYGEPSLSETEDAYFGYYGDLDQAFDQVAYAAPYHTMVKTIGNTRGIGPDAGTEHYVWSETAGDWVTSTLVRPKNCEQTGYDCIPRGASAKNIITVGGIYPFEGDGRYTTAEAVEMASYSSFGPTDDGRIKPDLVAVAENVYVINTTSDTSYYPTAYGTSYATPSITGTAALLGQLYYSLSQEFMTSAMAKALLINSANEAGNSPGPDYGSGWGVVNALEAAQTIVNESLEPVQAVLLEGTLEDGQVDTYTLYAIDGAENIKATLVWTDPEGEVTDLALNDRTPKLVNDLNIRIKNLTTDTYYYPWKLDPDNPDNPATKGVNAVDNVEKVEYENVATQYEIEITHSGSLSSSQNYSLVISGASLENLSSNEFNSDDNIVKIYPNPTFNSSEIDFGKNIEKATIDIFNLEGKKIKSLTIKNQNKVQVDVNELLAGIYIIHLNIEGQVKNYKLVKK